MNKLYRRILEKQLSERLPQLSLPFVKTAIKSKWRYPGGIVYCCSASQTKLIIELIPSQKLQSFTFEIGWSRLGRYPEALGEARPNRSDYREEFSKAEWMKRVGHLAGGDKWWWLEDRDDAERDLGRCRGKEAPRNAY